MRTALVLLLLLAVAAVPGSIFPQRSVGVEAVAAYRMRNPELSLWLERFDLFDVYGSPWFAAVYLLLFMSLVGCVLPRLRDHMVALRRRPPAAPGRLDRLTAHGPVGASALPAGDAANRLHAMLRRRRWRAVVTQEDSGAVSVAAEKGHLAETGNLLFHFSLVVLLLGVAYGYGNGWYANRILVAGPESAFCTTPQQFDEYGLGPRMTDTDLPRYCLELRSFTAKFLDNGQPLEFAAAIEWTDGRAPAQPYTLRVNEPLRLDGADVFLLGRGYAPILRYTDRTGRVLTSSNAFLPIDGNETSEGVALFPDANADARTGQRSSNAQMAFSGVFVPTVPSEGPPALSAFPAERDPAVILTAYRGNLGMETGAPQSVYTLPGRALDDGRLAALPGAPQILRPGERWELDDGSTLELLGTRRFITITVRNDPGEPIALAAAVALLAGLTITLSVHRRRVWFRATPSAAGCTIEVGGLPRRDHGGFEAEFTALRRAATFRVAATRPEEVDRVPVP